jgi:amidase
MRPLTEFITKDNPFVKEHTIAELWEWTSKRDKYRQEYAELWNSTGTGKDEFGSPTGMVDVILCPVGPGAAPPLNSARYWGYTSQWNILDYPGLVFPVGFPKT